MKQRPHVLGREDSDGGEVGDEADEANAGEEDALAPPLAGIPHLHVVVIQDAAPQVQAGVGVRHVDDGRQVVQDALGILDGVAPDHILFADVHLERELKKKSKLLTLVTFRITNFF